MNRLHVGILSLAALSALGVLRSQQQAASQTRRIPQFENADVKVWKSIIAPHAPLAMHRHDHGRVLVALKGGTVKIVEQNGKSEEQVWRPASPTGCRRMRRTRCTAT